MKACARCGTQNPDHLPACGACGLKLPDAKPAFGMGTLVMGAPGAPPVAPPPSTSVPNPAFAATSPLARGDARPAPAANLKGTMLGIAPPSFQPPAAATPPPAAPEPAARRFGGTMLGIAPPTLQSSPPEAPPAAPPPSAQAASAPRVQSAMKTVLGVARPGIAPLNPGQFKTPPA